MGQGVIILCFRLCHPSPLPFLQSMRRQAGLFADDLVHLPGHVLGAGLHIGEHLDLDGPVAERRLNGGGGTKVPKGEWLASRSDD